MGNLKSIDRKLVGRLLSAGALSEADLQAAIAAYPGDPPLHQYLVEKGLIRPAEAMRALAEVNGFSFVELEETHCDEAALKLLQPEEAWRRQALPIAVEEGVLTIALADPNDVYTPDNLRLRLNMPVRVKIAEPSDLRRALKAHYGPRSSESSASREVARLDQPAGQQPPPPEEDTQGESSHRAFQRRMRQLREAGMDDDRISQLETIVEEKQKEISTVEVDAGTRVRPQPVLPSAPPEEALLDRLAAEIVTLRAREAEFAPGRDNVIVRLRTHTQWVRVDAYPMDRHEPVIALLLRRLGREDSGAPSSGVLASLQSGNAALPCRLHLQWTPFGRRLLLQFPEVATCAQNPLIEAGLAQEIAAEVTGRLLRRAGGLLFISSPQPRALASVYTNLVRSIGASGRLSILSLERDQSAIIDGVTSIHCPTPESLAMDIENADAMTPDLLGVQQIPDAECLRRLVEVSATGISAIGCFTAPDAETAIACFRASGVDAMNLVRGTIGHLHLREVPRLCPDCRRVISEREFLPPWAAAHPVDFNEATGCDSCKGSGRLGTLLISSWQKPDLENPSAGFTLVSDLQLGFTTICLAGEADPRDLL